MSSRILALALLLAVATALVLPAPTSARCSPSVVVLEITPTGAATGTVYIDVRNPPVPFEFPWIYVESNGIFHPKAPGVYPTTPGPLADLSRGDTHDQLGYTDGCRDASVAGPDTLVF